MNGRSRSFDLTSPAECQEAAREAERHLINLILEKIDVLERRVAVLQRTVFKLEDQQDQQPKTLWQAIWPWSR